MKISFNGPIIVKLKVKSIFFMLQCVNLLSIDLLHLKIYTIYKEKLFYTIMLQNNKEYNV